MKKIILAAIAVIAAATLCACGNSTVVKDAVDTSLGEKIENMSVSAAAGTYFLTDMTEIGTNEKSPKTAIRKITLSLQRTENSRLNLRLRTTNRFHLLRERTALLRME